MKWFARNTGNRGYPTPFFRVQAVSEAGEVLYYAVKVGPTRAEAIQRAKDEIASGVAS